MNQPLYPLYPLLSSGHSTTSLTRPNPPPFQVNGAIQARTSTFHLPPYSGEKKKKKGKPDQDKIMQKLPAGWQP